MRRVTRCLVQCAPHSQSDTHKEAKMKRSRILTFVAILLAWAVLAAFGNVSASQNGEKSRVRSPLAIVATPTSPLMPRGTSYPKTTLTHPPAKPTSKQSESKEQRDKSGAPHARLPKQPSGTWQLITSESFEYGFPSAGWEARDLNHTPCQLCWDRAWYWDGTAYRIGRLGQREAVHRVIHHQAPTPIPTL